MCQNAEVIDNKCLKTPLLCVIFVQYTFFIKIFISVQKYIIDFLNIGKLTFLLIL